MAVYAGQTTATGKVPALLEDPEYQSYMMPANEAQQIVSGYVQTLGERIDNFFGDDSQRAINKGSKIILYTPLVWDEGTLRQDFHIKAEFELPKTNHRWKLIFDNWREELSDSPTDPASTNRQSPIAEQNENQLGARYLLDFSENQFSHIETGLKFRDVIDPNPYINYLKRYKNDLTPSWLSRTTHQLYLERARGFSWQAEQIFDYDSQKDGGLWRSQSDLSYWHDEGEWLFNQAFIKFAKWSANTASAYYVNSHWWLHEKEALQTVSIGANWRSRLYQDWLFGEVEPQVYFDRIDNFNQPNYRIRLQLEVQFYQPR